MAAAEETGGEGAAGAPSEELQRQIEEQIRNVRVQDLLLESVAGILNLTARRIAKEDERDLDQARVGIDAVRAVAELLDEQAREQVRQALSQVQMLFARAAQGGEPGESPEGADRGSTEAPEGGVAPGPGRASPERPSGLWTPPGAA